MDELSHESNVMHARARIGIVKGSSRVFCFLMALGLGTCLAQSPSKSAAPAAGSTTGICSFYSKAMDGHITASREKFDSNAMTAAHRTFPMGTKLKITNLSNQKSVLVTVNDRGPYVKGRTMSVTRHAAEELGFVKEGTAKVQIEKAP